MDIAFTENTIPGACVHSFTLERIWTATDDCGNTSIETQQIVVEDTTAPVLSGAPIDETVSCGAIPNPAVTLVASDNCDPNITIVFNEVSSESIIDCTTSYIITRTWTATDVCGNSSIAEQVVTVEGDASAPTLVGIPADETVECNAIPVVNQSLISATDNCDTSVGIAFTENTIPGACVHSFTLERIWTATDDCGNTSIEIQQIVVEDTTAPVLSGAPIDELSLIHI